MEDKLKIRNIIRIEINKPRRGNSAIELEHCPLIENGICRLENINCNYGLTEVKIPFPTCPLSNEQIITLKFKVKARIVES